MNGSSITVAFAVMGGNAWGCQENYYYAEFQLDDNEQRQPKGLPNK